VRSVIVCRTLGPVEVVMEGTLAPAELLWRKHLALLIYLARSPRRGRTREHLLGLLWADKPDSAARHSLNEAVRVLRRSLGESSLNTGERQVRLAPGVVQLDLEQLEAHAAEGRWCAAAELVAGEFMEGFAVPGAREFEEWLAAERATWRRHGVEVLVRCAEGLLQAGRVREAESLARRAATLDDRSDLAMRALMRTLTLAGERVMALNCFDDFVRRLMDDLSIRPEPETMQLAALVRRERTTRPTTGPTSGKGSRGDARLPLTGRAGELTRLLEMTSACRQERRATLLIVEGDAGSGKTRLLEELLARLRLDGAAVAEVRAVEADLGEPWCGVRALARGGLLSAQGIAAAPAAALATFATDIPEWADRFAGAAADKPLAPGRALREVLRAAVEEQPVFLAVDDAEWLDRESLLALESALRDLSATRLGLLLAISPLAPLPALDELRTRVGRELPGVVIVLGPLDIEGLRALARGILPSFSSVEIDRVVRRVGADSAGIPLLAVELLRAVALGMDLGTTSGAWPEPLKTLDQTLPGELPDAVVSAIRVGFRRLGRTAQQVLAAASIMDDRVTTARLARSLELSVDALTAALDELEWHRWLVSEPRGYAFVARVVRQVIARDMLTPGQRRRILEGLGRSA
jgi:DNA-binding SARP family transcriptional activator